MQRVYALYTLEGVPDADVTTHYFSTEDQKLGLSMLRFNRGPSDDAVLIIHGLTTSSDMFIMPEHTNLVRYLLDNGFSDVWCLDYRMSNRHSYNMTRHRFNLDDIALFDFPPAIARIREHIGDRRLHVIAHCLGSVSFTMSLFGKAVEGITNHTGRWGSPGQCVDLEFGDSGPRAARGGTAPSAGLKLAAPWRRPVGRP